MDIQGLRSLLEKAFTSVDTDGSGQLSLDQVRQAFNHLLRLLLRRADVKHSGRLQARLHGHVQNTCSCCCWLRLHGYLLVHAMAVSGEC